VSHAETIEAYIKALWWTVPPRYLAEVLAALVARDAAARWWDAANEA
jgi:hypothetical protein